MVYRNLVARIVLVAVVLVAAVAVGCSSGKKPSNPEPPPPPTNIMGTVFLDTNEDGLRGDTEAGLADVVVSNGVTTTTTGINGSFTLPKEGDFVFVTVPNTHAASGPWYRSVTGSQFDFGLKQVSGKAADSFTFIHMTDIHLDSANLERFEDAIEEFDEISPAFIVSTGDLVNEGNGTDTISEAQAAQWFPEYENRMDALGIPVYNVLGNHDATSLSCESAAGATAGCSKTAYRNSFGPTYYSFDWGQYHCVVLDPNAVGAGREVFGISAAQFAWLQKDLGYLQQSSPLLVFCHEPTASWQLQGDPLNVLNLLNQDVIDLLKQYKTRIFSGHSHADLLMDRQGIPEQVTAALSGEWWHGDNPDGSKPGYRIVSVIGSEVDSIYKAIGSPQQIEISPSGSTWPIVPKAQVELVAKIYTGSGSVSTATYTIDNATAVSMTLTAGSKWVTASATWDTSALTEDYYTITVTATDNVGSFQAVADVKVSADPTQPIAIKELQENLEVYQGHYVTIQGVTDQAMFNSPGVPAGSGGARFSDDGGTTKALIYAGECYSPALPSTIGVGDTVRARIIPMRFTWAFIDSSADREGTFDMFKMYEMMIPEGQKEDDAGGNRVARWFMRLVSADGIAEQ